jgi:hypothetical protein
MPTLYTDNLTIATSSGTYPWRRRARERGERLLIETVDAGVQCARGVPASSPAIAEGFIGARTRADPLVTEGLARWAAATERPGEIGALWATEEFPEHKAVLLDPDLLKQQP